MLASVTARPPIYVAEADFDDLSQLTADPASPGAALLAEELARATVVRTGEGPPAFVRLGSKVEFKDLMSDRVHTVTLVAPAQADMKASRLSVLAPAGAALIGLTPGDVFSWTVDGRPRLLVVNRVVEVAAS
jgi:regulator of nucleoside diphosphate kinase